MAFWQWLRQFRAMRPDEPLIPATLGGRWGVVAVDGVEAAPSVCEEVRVFDANGWAMVQQHGKHGWIYRAAKVMRPCQ